MSSKRTRQPLPATLRETPDAPDENLVLPDQCAVCGHDDLMVMLRTTYVVYVRCERCLTMRTVARLEYGREFAREPLNTMVSASLEAERVALLAEQPLEHAHQRLRQTADDYAAHVAVLARLNAHTARVRAFKAALQTRSVTSALRSIAN